MGSRTTAALLVLAGLWGPAGVQAETTQQMIKRLAEAGRKQTWVLPTDCPDEQAAVRQFQFEGASYGCDDGTGNDTEQSIAAALERPWVYRWGGKEDPSRLMTVNELKQMAVAFTGYAVDDEQRDRRVYSGAHCSATLERLTACAYRAAATRRDGGTPRASSSTVTAPAAAGLETPRCAPAAVVAANQALQAIDQRLAAFVESDAGQQPGTATPSLQTVMWGTREQIKVIREHCPDAEAFRQRIEDLAASYRAAESACRAVQTRPEICTAAAPP